MGDEPRFPAPPPHPLLVRRSDTSGRALVVLAGEIDLVSAPLIREALSGCLRDGVRTIDVDLGSVTFCDCTGVNAFLAASRLVTAAGGSLRLRRPNPAVSRLFSLTGSAFLMGSRPPATTAPATAAALNR